MTLSEKPITESPIGLLEGLSTTRAIRRYTEDEIPHSHLRDIIWSATRAPSGSNRQPFRFMVLTKGEKANQAKKLIGKAAQEIWDQKVGSFVYTQRNS